MSQNNIFIRTLGVITLATSCSLPWLFGCAAEVAGTTPPDQALYYPTTMEVSSDGRYVYVVNSNFNQTYSSGWISVIDLEGAIASAANDNLSIIPRADGGQLRVIGLGGELAISAAGTQALMPHRGLNPRNEVMISRLELGENGAISCGVADFEDGFTGREAATDCDEDHLIRVRSDGTDDLDPTVFPREDVVVGQQENGYHAHAFTWVDLDGEPREMVAIGYVNSGIVRFYELADGQYQFVDVLNTGLGSVGHLGLHPDVNSPFLIVGGSTSSVSRLASIDLSRSFSEASTIAYSHSQPPNGGRKVFAFDFLPGTHELLIANRSGLATGSPGTDSFANSLVRLNAGLQRTTIQNPDGTWDDEVLRPAMTVEETVLLNGRATDVLTFTKLNGDTMVAVPGFDNSKLSIFEASDGVLNLVSVLELDELNPDDLGVGEGPVVARHVQLGGKDLLLVLNFYGHSLSIMDVSADNANEFTLITKVQNVSN